MSSSPIPQESPPGGLEHHARPTVGPGGTDWLPPAGVLLLRDQASRWHLADPAAGTSIRQLREGAP
jgi:hypothetical protein